VADNAARTVTRSSITVSVIRVPKVIPNMIQAVDSAVRMVTRFIITASVTSVPKVITNSERVQVIAVRQDTRIILMGDAGNASREVYTIKHPAFAVLLITRITTMAGVTSALRAMQNTTQVAAIAARTVSRIILMVNAGSARKGVVTMRNPARAVQVMPRIIIMAGATSAPRDIPRMTQVAAIAARTVSRIISMAVAGSARKGAVTMRHPVSAVQGTTRFTMTGPVMSAKMDS
jgi:hypothetical protein